MTDRLSQAEIERLEELEKKATPGPWTKYDAPPDVFDEIGGYVYLQGRMATEDHEFILESRNLLPRLLAELRALREERDQARLGVVNLQQACELMRLERDEARADRFQALRDGGFV